MTTQAEPLVDLAVALPSLFGSPLAAMSAAELAGGVRRLDAVEAQAAARRAELIGEVERRGVAREEGFGSTTAWLMAVSGEPPAVCRSRVAVASALHAMPATREAFTAGEVSESRVKLLAQAQGLAPDQFARDESRLVAQAAVVPSGQFPKMLAGWRRSTDPEGAEADAERLREQRALHVSPVWSGMVHLSGDLDPEGGAVVLAALRSLAEPAALDSADTRTPAQCRADALVEICRRHGQGGGSRRGPQVLVTIPWDTLHAGRGVVDTETGPISGATARRLCCDATVSRVLLAPESVPVDMGRATRVVPAPLRRLVELRDGGCTHRGCGMPARFCDVHHRRHWADGGSTDLANLRLLCARHHTTVHQHDRHRRQE